jgi:hypothetical protein
VLVWRVACLSRACSGLVGSHSPRGSFCHTVGPLWVVVLQALVFIIVAAGGLVYTTPALLILLRTVQVGHSSLHGQGRLHCAFAFVVVEFSICHKWTVAVTTLSPPASAPNAHCSLCALHFNVLFSVCSN